MKDAVLKDLMFQGGIDVLVRIERIYNPPRTRKGIQVESPLEALHRDQKKTPTPRTQLDLNSPTTPNRILRSSANATRIPTAIDPRLSNGSGRRSSGGSQHLPRNRTDPTRRVLFSSGLRSPSRSRNPRQAVALRRELPSEAHIEVIDIGGEE